MQSARCAPLPHMPQTWSDTKAVSQAPLRFHMFGFSDEAHDGSYVQSGPRVNGMPAFMHESENRWCCYVPSQQYWVLQPAEKKGSVNGLVSCEKGKDAWDTGGAVWQEWLSEQKRLSDITPLVMSDEQYEHAVSQVRTPASHASDMV